MKKTSFVILMLAAVASISFAAETVTSKKTPAAYSIEKDVTDKEVKAYYDANPKAFKIKAAPKGSMSASHILIMVKEKADVKTKAAAKAKAEKLLALLKKDASLFAELAEKESQCPSGKNKGSLGSFTKGRMVPEFEQAVVNLKTGEISAVVETKFGYHIIRRDASHEGTNTFAEVKDIIKAGLRQKKIFAHKGTAYKYFDYGDSVKTIKQKLSKQKFKIEKHGINTTFTFSQSKDITIFLDVVPQTGLYAYSVNFTIREGLEKAIIEKYTKKYGKPESIIKSSYRRYYWNSRSPMVNHKWNGTLVVPNCKVEILRKYLKWRSKKEYVHFYSSEAKENKALSLIYSGEKPDLTDLCISKSEGKALMRDVIAISETIAKRSPNNTKISHASSLWGVNLDGFEQGSIHLMRGGAIIFPKMFVLSIRSIPLSLKADAIIKVAKTKMQAEILAKQKAKRRAWNRAKDNELNKKLDF